MAFMIYTIANIQLVGFSDQIGLPTSSHMSHGASSANGHWLILVNLVIEVRSMQTVDNVQWWLMLANYGKNRLYQLFDTMRAMLDQTIERHSTSCLPYFLVTSITLIYLTTLSHNTPTTWIVDTHTHTAKISVSLLLLTPQSILVGSFKHLMILFSLVTHDCCWLTCAYFSRRGELTTNQVYDQYQPALHNHY